MSVSIVRTHLAAALSGLLVVLSFQPASADNVRFGGDIKIHGRGDAVAIGDDITIDEGTDGDVAAIGGDIDIAAGVAGDVSVIGRDVRISATVKGDVVVASGDFELSKSGIIEKDLSGAAGKAAIDGTVKGDVDITGGTVVVSGTIERTLEVRGGEVTIADGARIGGKLIVSSPKQPTVAAGAHIGGGAPEYTYIEESDIVWGQGMFHGGLFIVLAVGVMSILFLAPIALVAGLFLVFILAQFSERTVQAFNTQPVSSFFTGIGVVVFLPIVFALLVATIIGIPLAVLLAPLYPFWLLLGFVGGALGLSRLPFRDKVPSKGLQLLYLLIAFTIIAVLAWIPFVGYLLIKILFLMGTGALTLALFKNGRGASVAEVA